MLHELDKNPDLLYPLERIDFDGGSCVYGVMCYNQQIYELFTAQLCGVELAAVGEPGDVFPSVVYMASGRIITNDTLHVYTREGFRRRGYGSDLLEAAIKHCLNREWDVSLSTSIDGIARLFEKLGLVKAANGCWRPRQASS